jgi:UDP-glucose 4-epimerase
LVLPKGCPTATKKAKRVKVLITGGAGFIGSHIARYFLEAGHEVVVLDSLRSGRCNVDESILTRGSVTDYELVDRLMAGVRHVFHLAALVSVPESLEKPHECVDINVQGTLNVLRAARRHGVEKVVLSSSAAVYGDDPELPKRESMRPAPKTPYAVTKLDGEYYLAMAAAEWGVPTVSLRYFNVYGPGQDPASQYAAAVPIFVQRARQGERITIFGDGSQTRDFIHVRDVVAANVLAASRPDLTGVYNVARGESLTILELARKIVALMGSSSEIVHGPERPGDIRHSLADVTRLRQTGFTPTVTLEVGLRETLTAL